MKIYTLALSVAIIGSPVFASSTFVAPEQNPLCPKTITKEVYDQLNSGTYPGLKIKGAISGVRHRNPGFKWDVPGLTLEQGNMRNLGAGYEDLKDNCFYVEKKSPENNFLLFVLDLQ